MNNLGNRNKRYKIVSRLLFFFSLAERQFLQVKLASGWVSYCSLNSVEVLSEVK